MLRGGHYSLVHRFVGREYLLSLAVAFAFFFFIFFINQILLIVQKIMVKNVSVKSVLTLVSLSIPQFLLYTFPFSSLTAAAMVLGEASTSNELLAIRSSGISLRQVFYPICIFALTLSLITFLVADLLLPYSARQYKNLYTKMMHELPTLELNSFGANTIGNTVMVNGAVEGSLVDDLVLFDTDKSGEKRVISSTHAKVGLVDLHDFVYFLDLVEPQVFITKKQSTDWNLAKADTATVYLDFSSQIPALTDSHPSQLSVSELRVKIQHEKKDFTSDQLNRDTVLRGLRSTVCEQSESAGLEAGSFNQDLGKLEELEKEQSVNFYFQYYRAELQKKMALSMACLMLVFLTFPLAYLRLKHGRLIGFGIAMLSAVAYWYMLFFAQLNIFKTAYNPLFLIWFPNIFLFLLGIILTMKAKK